MLILEGAYLGVYNVIFNYSDENTMIHIEIITIPVILFTWSPHGAAGVVGPWRSFQAPFRARKT